MTHLEELARKVEAGIHPSDLCFEIADMPLDPKVQGASYDCLMNNSIDAVEKLRRELCPYFEIKVESVPRGYTCVVGGLVMFRGRGKSMNFEATASTEAAARLAALLRALDKESE